jgi:hypothetical protein
VLYASPFLQPRVLDHKLTTDRDSLDQARRLLRLLYIFRIAFAAIWVTLVLVLSSSTTKSGSQGLLVGVALGSYPGVDGLATFVDLRTARGSSVHWLLWSNLVAGIVAAIGIVWLNGNLGAQVRAFGIWAIASGVIQLVLGVIRQSSFKGQWPMIISGGGSIVAGITFAGLAGTSAEGLPALAQYSIGGAIWYLAMVGWLIIATRIHSTTLTGD